MKRKRNKEPHAQLIICDKYSNNVIMKSAVVCSFALFAIHGILCLSLSIVIRSEIFSWLLFVARLFVCSFLPALHFFPFSTLNQQWDSIIIERYRVCVCIVAFFWVCAGSIHFPGIRINAWVPFVSLFIFRFFSHPKIITMEIVWHIYASHLYQMIQITCIPEANTIRHSLSCITFNGNASSWPEL